MMKRFKLLMICLVGMFFLGWGPGATPQAPEQQMSEEDQKMMKLWMEYATPGPNHKHLEYFEGAWEAETKMWMKPGTEPAISKMTATGKMLFGGRYLKVHYQGTMMGMPFEGLQFTAYDNFKKKYISVWFDSAGTGFYEASGTLDKTRKTRTENGLWDDFMTGKKSRMRMVTKIIDDNQFLFEMYYTDPKSDKEFKSSEMIFKKKK